MARQIHTLAIGRPHVGARVQAKTMGSKAPADCVLVGAIRLLARVLVKRFTFSLPVRFGVVTSKEDCNRWVQQQREACRSGRHGDGGTALSGISPG